MMEVIQQKKKAHMLGEKKLILKQLLLFCQEYSNAEMKN